MGHAGIALVRYPAKVPRDHPAYRGPVLFNYGMYLVERAWSHSTPLVTRLGGPGQSGVSITTLAAPSFQELLGPEYDIIGFDPRSVEFYLLRYNNFKSHEPPVIKLL